MLCAILTLGALVFAGGCGSELANFGAGAITGGALSETFKGAEADLERAKQAKIAEHEAALEKLANTTNEVEKLALTAKVKALEKTIENLQLSQEGVQLAREGTKVNWSDPEAVGGYGGTVLASLLALYFRKKGNKSEQKYQAHKQGAAKIMIDKPEIAPILYAAIGEARVRNKVA